MPLSNLPKKGGGRLLASGSPLSTILFFLPKKKSKKSTHLDQRRPLIGSSQNLRRDQVNSFLSSNGIRATRSINRSPQGRMTGGPSVRDAEGPLFKRTTSEEKVNRDSFPTNSRKQQRNRGNPRDSCRNDRKTIKGGHLFPREKISTLIENRPPPASQSSQPIPKNWTKETSRPAKVNDVAFPLHNPHDIPELVPAETEAPAGSAPGTPTGHLKRVGSIADRYRNSL
jgi:hypothetical protein